MKLHELQPAPGSVKAPKRVGRGTGSGMGKTEDTRKAFVNSYATENAIYLLYSGNKRTEENWAYGSEIFVYSWDGTPLKRYLLDRPVYTFAVDETKKVIYSYSLKSDELVKGQI